MTIIMKATEIKDLLTKVTGNTWKFSHIREKTWDVIRWLPITSIGQGRWVGMSEDGYWVVEGKENEVIIISADNSLIFLLQCLERPRAEFVESLNKGLSNNNLSIVIAQNFPFDDLIACGLTFGNDYWAELALEWLKDQSLNKKIKDALTKLIKFKGASQKLRHKAQRILKSNDKGSVL